MYYVLDLLVGFGGFVFLWARREREPNGGRDWRAFLLGCALGLLWEVPVFTLSVHSPWPMIHWVRPLPAPYPVFLVAHTFWDGLLFVAAVWGAERLFGNGAFGRFRVAELAWLVAWGQFTSVLVEVSSVLHDGWIYVAGYAWNPTLATLAGRPLTLWPQVPWLVAPVVFYAFALRTRGRFIRLARPADPADRRPGR